MNIQFHLTYGCNLKCKHCYQEENYNNSTISIKDFITILNKTKQYFDTQGLYRYGPLDVLVVTGGEPLIIPNWDEYMHIGDKYFDHSVILTNGLLVNPSDIEKFKSLKDLLRVQVSLEGPEPINDMIRGTGTYKKICNSIKLLMANDITTAVSCTLADYNYNHIDELYYDLTNNAKPSYLWFDRCIPFKEAKSLNASQFYEFLATLKKIRKEWHQKNLFTEPKGFRALQFLALDNPDYIYMCGAGYNHFTIMPNGDLMICRRLNFPVGNLLEEDWPEIMQRIEPYIDAMHQPPDECQNCRYAYDCAGGLKCLTYETFKDFNHKDICCLGEYNELLC